MSSDASAAETGPSFADTSGSISPGISEADMNTVLQAPPDNSLAEMHGQWQQMPELSATMSFEDYVGANLWFNTGTTEEKPLGYLPLSTLTSVHSDPLAFIEQLQTAGARVKVIGPERTQIASGALYSYRPDALQAMLDANVDTLRQAGWPEATDEFVDHVNAVSAPVHTPLFDLVADAFADRDNPGRTQLSAAPTRQ